MIRSRSTSATVRPTSARRAGGGCASRRRVPPRGAGLGMSIASARSLSPRASSTARCMQFSSSRTLPRQGMARSSAIGAAAERRASGRPLAAASLAAKCRASAAMSCGRSRSGGSCSATTFRRNSRSSRKRPSRDRARRGRGCWWRSAGYRPCTGLVPPTRSISRSWMARSSLACRRGSISLISSSSSVPPSASSNLPMRRAMAPVKAPFSWPNSSRFQQVLGDGGAVDARRTGRVRAPAVAVDEARHHLLAGAALAGDQHAGLGRGELPGAARARRAIARVGADQLVPLVAGRRQDRGDQLGIGRQRQELLGAGPGSRPPPAGACSATP